MKQVHYIDILVDKLGMHDTFNAWDRYKALRMQANLPSDIERWALIQLAGLKTGFHTNFLEEQSYSQLIELAKL